MALGLFCSDQHVQPPFWNENHKVLFEDIKNIQPTFEGADLSDEALDLLKRVIHHNSLYQLSTKSFNKDIFLENSFLIKNLHRG